MELYSKTMESRHIVSIGDGIMPAYTISLDEIDLSLIPIFSHQQRDLTVPLWSPAASGPGAEYYELQVLVDEGSSDDERLENASTHVCHICNVDVCTSYWLRHTTSTIHQANQAITQTSLNRVQQTALALPVTPPAPRTTTYFCHPCSSAVAISKRTAHKQSEQHSSAVLYEQLLQSLARLYESKDNLVTVCEDVLMAIGDHDTIFESLKTRNFFEDKKNIDEKIDEIQQENLKKEGDKSNEDDDSTTSESEASNVESEPDIPTEYTITALTGAKLRIAFANYHGLACVSNATLCRVCRVMLQDTQQHLAMKTHFEKLTVPVKDKHCIRPLTTVLSHCMLCNDLVGNSDEGHVTSDAHIAALQRALVQDDARAPPEDAYTKQVLTENHIQTLAYNQQNYFCQVCQIHILKSALMEHIALEAHKNGLITYTKQKKVTPIVERKGSSFCNYCKVTISCGKRSARRHRQEKAHKLNEWLAEKDTVIHYHCKESDPEHVICKICLVRVGNFTVNEHVNGFNHQKRYANLLKVNHMQKTGEYSVDCILCNSKLYMIDVINHIEKFTHRKKIQQCLDNEIGPEEFILMHRPNQDCNNSKVKKILHLNQIYNYNKNDNIYICRICNTHFQKPLLVKHILSKKHIKGKRLASASQSASEVKPKSKSLFFVEYENPINMNKENKLYSPTNVPTYEIPGKQKETDTNDDPELEFALKTNLIESHSDRYNWCNACKRLVAKDLNIMLHIDSKNHKKNLADHDDEYLKSSSILETNRIEKRLMKYYCNACDVNIEVGYEYTHIKQESHASNIAEIDRLRQDELLKTGAQYYCSVCSEWVPRGLEYVHIANEKHNINYEKEEKLKSQGVVKAGINYFCEVCLVSVQRWFGEEHINSVEHLLMFKAKYKYKGSNDDTECTENATETQANSADAAGLRDSKKEVDPVKITDKSGLAPEIRNSPAKITSQEIGREMKAEHDKMVEENTSETQADSNKTTDDRQSIRETQANHMKTSVQPMPKLTLQNPNKKLHYLFDWTQESGNEIMCLVCKTNLSFYDVMSHRKSKTHKEVYKDVLDTNTMFRIRHRCFCECCREIIKVNEEYTHITSKNHRCNLTRNTTRLNKNALMELSIKMFNEDIATEKRRKTHERYDRTTFAMKESDDEESNSETDDAFGSVYSSTVTLDQVSEENDSENKNSNLNTSFESVDTNNLDHDETDDVENLCKIPEDHEVVDYIILKTQSQDLLELPDNFQNIAHLFEKTDNIKELSCLICKTVVPNWSDQIVVHVEGKKHIKKYNRVLQINNFKEMIDEVSNKDSGTIQKYICKSCGTDVGKTNLFEHINSEKHIIYLNSQPSTSGLSQQPSETKTDPKTTEVKEAKTTHITINKTENQKSTKTSSNISIDHSKLQVQQLHEINITPAEIVDPIKTDCVIKQLNQTTTTKSELDILQNKLSDEIQIKSVKISKNIGNPIEIKVPNESLHDQISIKTRAAPVKTKDKKPSVDTQTSSNPTLSKCEDVSQLNVKPTVPTQIAPAGKEKCKHNLDQSDKTQTVPISPPHTKDNQQAPKNYLENKLCLIPNNVTSIGENLTGIQHSEKLKASKINTTHSLTMTKENSHQKQIITSQTSNLKVTKITPTINNENNVATSNASDQKTVPYIKEGNCILCKTGVLGTDSNVKEHVNGNKHKKMLLSLLTNKNIVADQITSNMSETNTDFCVTEGHCIVCNTKVPNNPSNVKEHVNGNKHKLLQFWLVNRNTFEDTTKSNEVNQQNNENNTIKAGSSQSKTSVKKINIPYISATDAELLVNNVNIYVKNGHCYLCSIKIPNCVSNITNHVKGNIHQRNLKQFDTIEINYQSPSVLSKPIKNNSAEIVEKISNPENEGLEVKLPENSIDNYAIKLGHCYLCSLDIPNNISCIEDHVDCKTHRKNLQSFLSKTDTTKTLRGPDIKVNQNNDFECNQNTAAGNIETSIEREIVIPIIWGDEFQLPVNNIDTYVKKGYCYLCDTKVPINIISNIKDHVDGEKHKLNLQNLVSNNSTIKISYFCSICNIKMPKKYGSVINHLKNTTHKVNVEKHSKLNDNSLHINTTAAPYSTNIGSGSSSSIVGKVSDIDDERNINKDISDSGIGDICQNNVNTLKPITIVKDDTDIGVLSSTNDIKTSKAIYKSKGNSAINFNANPTDPSLNIIIEDFSTKRNVTTKSYNTAFAETNNTPKNDSAVDTEASIMTTYSTYNVPSNDFRVNKEELPQSEYTNTPIDDSVNVDACDTTPGSTSTSNVGAKHCDVIEKQCFNDKTMITIANNKPVNASVDKDANSAVIVNDCKTEDDETDDSDVEALEDGFYICRVCDKLILDNEADIKSHFDSVRHNINLKEKHFKEGMFPNIKTLCNICNLDVPKNPKAAKKHAESDLHKWRFEKILLENKIKIRDDKVCYCEVCDLYFSKFTVSTHIKRPDHFKYCT